jgi:hypothetical protein
VRNELIVILTLCLGACAEPVQQNGWTKPYATPADYATDERLCRSEARAQVNEEMQYLSFFNRCMRNRGWAGP